MERDFGNSQIKLELEDSKVPEDNYEEISDSFIKTEVFHNGYEVNEDQIRTKKNSDTNKDISNVKNKYKHLILCLKKLTKNEIEMYQDLTKKPRFGTGAWNKKIECKICGKILNSRHSMLIHVKNHLGLTFDCDVCHKKFTWKTNLNDHKITHKVTPNLFPCPKCGKIFMQKCRLNGHIRTVHDPSNLQCYQCHQCDKSFKRKSQLAKHVNTDHSGNLKGIATQKASPVSDKSISTKNLNEHMKIHSGTRIRYPCDVCNHTFARPSGVRVHKLNVHSKPNLSLFEEECKICFKMMNSSILENHGKYHSGENPFLCEICLKSAPSKSAFYNHNLKWHEEKIGTWKECPVCDKSILAYNLDKHIMNKHSGMRYPCDLCNQTFARPDGARYHKLTVHSKINVSLLEEECKICFKMIKSSILEKHGKYHSGENPFLCTICLKSAPSRNALYKHNLRWHDINWQPNQFRCSKCPKTFKYRVNFLTHEKSHDGTSVLKKENPDPKEIESDCILGL